MEHQIDLSKIEEGEVLYNHGIYDKLGNYLRPVTYINEKKQKIMKEEPKLKDLEQKLKDIEEFGDKDFVPTILSSLMQEEFKDGEWLVEGFIPLEGTTALSGSPASFKTWLALQIAIKVAAGEKLFDKFATKQTGVLIIDEENGKRLMNSRMKKLCQDFGLPIHFVCLEGFKLNTLTVGIIISMAEQLNIGFIIFDSLVRIHKADEDKAMQMAEVFRHFKELNKSGLTVLVTWKVPIF